VNLHPYHLKQYNNRWFLFGRNEEKNSSTWNLAIDRIMDITESSEKYIPNTEIDWFEYFDDSLELQNLKKQFWKKSYCIFTASQANMWRTSLSMDLNDQSGWIVIHWKLSYV
jgi:hypothetical protein